jgi:hypothetical protein
MLNYKIIVATYVQTQTRLVAELNEVSYMTERIGFHVGSAY